MEKKQIVNKFKGIIPAVARKLGEQSVDQACVWWFNQPKVPQSMKMKD